MVCDLRLGLYISLVYSAELPGESGIVFVCVY